MGLLGCLPLINGIGDLLMPYRYLSESNTILNYEILDTDEEQVILRKGLAIHIPLYVKHEIFMRSRQLATILIEVMERHSVLEKEQPKQYSDESRQGKPKYMNITQEHVNIAFEIDNKYKELDEAGLDNASLLVEMYDLMPKFKKLMDELSNDDFNHLSDQFSGFYDYAKYIEWIATQIASGEIKVPR